MGFYLNKIFLLKTSYKMQSNTDWDSVTYLRKTNKGPGAAKSKKAVNAAMRRGGANVETRTKQAAGSNKKAGTTKNTLKLDLETEELSHSTVSLSVERLIQKELATKINEKPQVVNEYEAGKAIPNNQVMGKLERAVGIKLRGKDIGKELPQRGAKK